MSTEPCQPSTVVRLAHADCAVADEALRRALVRAPDWQHPVFTERLMLDWERVVRQAAAAPRPAPKASRPAARWVRWAVAACALPLCLLWINGAAERIAAERQLHGLLRVDPLADLALDLL